MILIPKITNIHSFAHVVFSGTALRVKRALTLSAVLICLLAALSGVAVAQDQASCTAYLATNPNPSGIPAVSGSGVAQRNALDHGWSMCDEMPYGESFVNTHGGSTTLYKDPTGTHHSLPSSATPREQMFDFLVASTATPTPIPTPSIIWRHQGDGKVYGMTTNGSTVTSGAQFWQETNPAWSIVGQGDFDGDGVRDLAWWNSSNGQVYLMLMSGPTAVKSGAIVYTEANTAWKIVATGDINGDGKSDLIWWNSSTGQVYAMLMNGTATTGGAIIYTEPNTAWKIVSAADFDANGSVDLLWWNSTTGQTALGRTNGTNASTARIIYTESNTNWRIAGAGDLDGDGKADIVWHNRTTGQVYGMQTNGTAVTTGALICTEANTNWEIVSIGDYTGDNKADLLWWNRQTGQVWLMPMNGLSVAGGSLLYTEADTTWHIQGETEWRDNLYGTGATTTSTVVVAAAGGITVSTVNPRTVGSQNFASSTNVQNFRILKGGSFL